MHTTLPGVNNTYHSVCRDDLFLCFTPSASSSIFLLSGSKEESALVGSAEE